MPVVGYFLWTVLFLGTIGQIVFSWVTNRSKFDLFEAKNIFLAVFFIYYGIPSLYYLIANPGFPGVNDTASSLRWVLFYSLIGVAAFYLGYRIKLPSKINLPMEWDKSKLLWVVAAFSVLAVAAGAILLPRVGGACYYLTHLGQTNVLLVGNIYFVWGLLLAKLAALMLLAYYLSTKPKGFIWKVVIAAYLIVSGVIITAIGARLLLVVYLVEVLVLLHYLWKRVGLKFLALIGLFVLVFIVGVLGEYRTFTWSAPSICPVNTNNSANSADLKEPLKNQDNATSLSPSSSPTTPTSPTTPPTPVVANTYQNYGNSFLSELRKTATNWQLLIDRYINNYFDSVLTTMVVIDNTPQTLSYQLGSSYINLLVQPLPRSIRPTIRLPFVAPSKGSPEILSGGTGYSRILSLLGEAYLNFAIFGIILIPLLIGVASRFSYDFLLENKNNLGAVLIYAIIIGGLMMEVRGYFVGESSFFLMDLVPILLVLLWFKLSAPTGGQ